MWRVYLQQHDRLGRYYTFVQRQPSWVIKCAIWAAVFVVVIPVVVLTLAAVFIAGAVLLLFGSVAWLTAKLGSVLVPSPTDVQAPPDDGRRNVRVIDPR